MLHNLPKKIKDIKSDVSAFNQHVREVVSGLASAGAVLLDIIVYLFHALVYHNFRKFVERKKKDYVYGRETYGKCGDKV
jgi:hypothetical protein